jgi:hypothetical protein
MTCCTASASAGTTQEWGDRDVRTLTAAVTELRAEVTALHADLVRYGLVVWTAGNVSARVPATTCW